MTTTDTIRNEIIGKLLTISNKTYLSALNKIVENSNIDESKVKLTEEQKLMLDLSDQDIKAGRTILQSELNKQDLKWLKEL